MAIPISIGNSLGSSVTALSSGSFLQPGQGAKTAGIDTLFLSSLFTQGLSGFANAYSQATAYEIQGNYQKNAAEFNAKLAEIQGEDAVRRGDRAAAQVIKQGRQAQGAQRASLAAQGIDVNSGTAAQIQEDTAVLSELDALTVKTNAWRERWGLKVSAVNSTAQGQYLDTAATQASRSTLLTGGLQAANTATRAGDYIRRRT